MSRSPWNPKPSDYAGQFRLGGVSVAAGLLLLMVGSRGSGNWTGGIMFMIGVSLLIGGGAVILTAYRSKARADKTENE